MEITRHFTATVLIVHHNRVLLHRHKKFGSLLPVGGHIDRNELPEETALRKAKEEAGLDIELYNPKSPYLGVRSTGLARRSLRGKDCYDREDAIDQRSR